MKETIEILSNKRLMKDIKQGIDDIKKGKYITFEDFEKKHHLL
jgi:PHD/YefM family antitoxin component YafN of YafNO toxin-antitoxin module